LKVLHALAALE